MPMTPNFKIEDDDLYLGNDVWIRWTSGSSGERDSALVIHKKAPGKYCWGSISLKNDPDAATRPTWEFDGNWEKPTLSPSVLCWCKFHGWIREGRWVNA